MNPQFVVGTATVFGDKSQSYQSAPAVSNGSKALQPVKNRPYDTTGAEYQGMPGAVIGPTALHGSRSDRTRRR
jgi:hypothetical protein